MNNVGINNVMQNNKGLSLIQKITIVVLLFILFALIVLIVFFPNNKNKIVIKKHDSRTVMIYMVGSNLETDWKIATSDLDAIDTSKINFDNTNVLLYTGGTKKWHNFIKNDENAIYKLTSDGFEKIETYDRLNMGDPDVFSDFLKYAYDNYNADSFDLVLYDHGGAIHGAIYDDFSGDNLSLEDFIKALDDSPFNEDNKMEAVIFRTCLNGTLEVANIFAPYADYLAASEEKSWGNGYSDLLGFISDSSINDDGYQLSKNFIQRYDIFMNNLLNGTNKYPYTYSIIDLNKIESVNNELNKFIKGVDLNKNYTNISKIRYNLYQFAKSGEEKQNTVYYDTIDLKSFIKSIESYSSASADDLYKAIDSAVLYSISNISSSNGLSIYFPYNGNQNARTYFMNNYKSYDFLDDYYDFIYAFNNKKNGAASFAYDFSSNETSLFENNQEVSFKLTDEQVANYAGANYIIFEKNPENQDYYFPIYSSNDLKLGSDGVLKTSVGKKLIKAKFKDGTSAYLPLVNRVRETFSYNLVMAFVEELNEEYKMYNLDVNFVDKNGVPVIDSITLRDEDESKIVSGAIFDLTNFKAINFPKFSYKIIGEDGKYNMSTETWNGIMNGYYDNIDSISYEYSGLDDGEFYCVFHVVDINGNSYYSNLIEVGK